ncbi:MAG: hypothetical protein A2Y28_02620 [Chlamydiae bacterium GWC2_50_10]|nr:MAG: hypothetical protein A2Y28_02620 [Chlamydiae bacterium GWC2_50_10]OGN57995.1 MAG: hypothetical protein A3D18_05580 [Chlamydiae bacterium RIFCSPHIGHO2_02_FULL_49_29]OGN63177.1 MAG: hypothetical protein A3E26_06325 [Chlamydiae bacterium RIFCSPHIGHO2_12_FULL_49_32]OGN67631.1 MAG: hypothetical protein A3I15_02905 [Chlamydiae bacterium RIFCSPLOWO2_02_FULL_49_12]OGN70918.1 MAG: hypothetical protein A3G30_06195 [Chlamydiae bacterium RIFCSPLOWO2_12_FULL_49_12]HBR18717.1 hypothetical protein [P
MRLRGIVWLAFLKKPGKNHKTSGIGDSWTFVCEYFHGLGIIGRGSLPPVILMALAGFYLAKSILP